MKLVTTVSRITRNSPNNELLRNQCRGAMANGGYFTITEVYENNDWYTEFTIVVPVDAEQEAEEV